MRQDRDEGITKGLCTNETRPPGVRQRVRTGLGSEDAFECGSLSSLRWKENKEVVVYM